MLASLPEPERRKFLASLTEAQSNALLYDWQSNARRNQIEPGTPGAQIARADWAYWLILAGRGFGKTRAGAETVRSWVNRYSIIHLVGPTASDVRDVMVEGESGILNCFPPAERPLYTPSKRLVTFHNGAVARTFSADEPERLRGPQCMAFWADEIAAWRFAQDAWDNLLFGFRLGDDPRGCITTTPKPSKFLKELISDPDTVVTRGSTYENKGNLAGKFFNKVIRKYEGTRLGRQELLAEMLEDNPGALWKMAIIEATRIKAGEVRWELIVRIVIGVDPAVSTNSTSDDTGIVVVALARSGHVVVLDDLSLKGTPLEWANVVTAAFHSRKADRVVGEVNNGGDLVEANLRSVAPTIPFRKVHASKGKAIRAEPVAALYEQGRVHHAGTFGALEEEMCSWVPDSGEKSPDRMDALVWAITELVIDREEETFTLLQPLRQISRI